MKAGRRVVKGCLRILMPRHRRAIIYLLNTPQFVQTLKRKQFQLSTVRPFMQTETERHYPDTLHQVCARCLTCASASTYKVPCLHNSRFVQDVTPAPAIILTNRVWHYRRFVLTTSIRYYSCILNSFVKSRIRLCQIRFIQSIYG